MSSPADRRTAVRTYLEMREPGALRPARRDDLPVRVERLGACVPSFWRYLYTEVGRRYHWVDRLSQTDEAIAAYLADPAVSLWLLVYENSPAGYFELRQDAGDGVEIAYLGLLDAFIGRGLGGHLVSEAVERAWSLAPARVWLHTCTLDHPSAMANYAARGFTPYRTEEYPL